MNNKIKIRINSMHALSTWHSIRLLRDLDRSYSRRNYRSKHLRHKASIGDAPFLNDSWHVCFLSAKRRQKTTVALNHEGYRSSSWSADKWDSYTLAVITAGPRAADGWRRDRRRDTPGVPATPAASDHMSIYDVPWQTKKPRRMYQHVFKHTPAPIASRQSGPETTAAE